MVNRRYVDPDGEGRKKGGRPKAPAIAAMEREEVISGDASNY